MRGKCYPEGFKIEAAKQGSGNTHIATIVNRKSRFTIILKLAGKDAESVHDALLATFKKMPPPYRKSLT